MAQSFAPTEPRRPGRGSSLALPLRALHVATVIPYAVHRGWVDAGDVVSGRVLVQHRHRRHQTFALDDSAGGGVFLKQLGHEQPDVVAGFERECALYRGVASHPSAQICAALPRFVGEDRRRNVVAVDRIIGAALVDGAQDPVCTADARERIGTTLAKVHSTDIDIVRSILPSAETGAPWAFHLPQHLVSNPAQTGGGARELAGFLTHRGQLLHAIHAAAQRWQPTALIHGDFKRENVMVTQDGEIRIVDWESVQIGDPAWDVAYFLQSGLGRTLLQRGGAHALALSDVAWDQIGRRALWSAWARSRSRQNERDLERVVAFCAVRFVHAAYEHAVLSPTLPHVAAAMVATADHMLARPKQGRRLLGVGS